MINLGRFNGGTMPQVRLYATWVDHLMEVIAFLLLLGIWVFTLLNIDKVPSEARSGVYMQNGALTFAIILMGACAYAPLGSYNFPFRLTEYNYVTQYQLASRLCRGMTIGIALLMGCLLAGQFNTILHLDPQIVSYLVPVGITVSVIPFAVYYLLAFLWR